MTTAKGATANHRTLTKAFKELSGKYRQATFFECEWWDLRISGMVLPVMKPTLQEDDGDHPTTTTNDEIYVFLILFFQS